MKILYVAPNLPHKPHTGSAQRTALLHHALSELGEVRFVCLHSKEKLTNTDVEQLNSEFGLKAIVPRTGFLTKNPWKQIGKFNKPTAARLGNFWDASRSRFEPDPCLIAAAGVPHLLSDVSLIVGRYTTSLTALGLINRGIPVILDVDDLDSQVALTESSSESSTVARRWVAKRHYKNIVTRESRVFSAMDALFVANPDDRSQTGLEQATILPNIPFLIKGESISVRSPQNTQKIIGCVASWSHRPNIEGMNWFLTNVWPKIMLAIPTACMHIYGSQMSPELKDIWNSQDNVRAIGFVDNVKDAYETMTLSICPVHRGAGTNIKVLESAAYNRLCILTESASRGLTYHKDLKNTLQIATDASEMSNLCVKFLSDIVRLEVATQQFKSAVEKNYSYDSFKKTVLSSVSSVMSSIPDASGVSPLSNPE